ncbi:MAG: sensor histidine kinase [Gaiella sp.]
MTGEASARERLLAERDERRRIAELVHDGPVQYVAALTQMLDSIVAALDEDDIAHGRAIAVRSLEIARDAAAELREIATGLEPIALSDDGLVVAVRELARRVASRHGFAVELELTELAELGDGAASGLYQIVREALDQTVRRGPPTTVRIDFHPTASGGVELTVADDAAPERRQAVLDGLAERAADLNAVLVDDRNETGTSVTVTLPPSAARL